MEFAIRFSRHYLYDLNRLLISIQKHLGIISSRAGLKQRRKNIAFYQDIIKQKLIAAHQLLMQALNAYCKHIPNSVLEGHPTKLQEVLQVVCNLRDICGKVEISTNCLCSGDTNIWPVEKDVQDKLDAILSELKQSLECKHPPIRYRNVESAVNVAQISSRNKRYSVKKNLSGRLSMYSVDVHKNNQKKKNALKGNNYCCQNDKKWNVVDTKSTCSQHYSIPELLYPSPVTHTSSSRDIVQIDSAKSMNCSKDDDDIKTMMDRVPIDSETEKSSTGIWKVKSTGDNEANIIVENVTNDDDLIKKVTTITKEHLSTLVPVISDLMTHVSKTNESNVQPLTETTVETLVEFLQKYQRPKDSDTKAKLTDEHSRMKLNGLSEIQRHEKNVRLIYVSSVDEVSKSGQCDASCQANYETGVGSTDDRKAMGSVSKDPTELTISRETELQFLAYKHEYKSLCRSKPMYSSNTQNKPWDIVAWISDKLIEELIIEITEELQMTDVIKKMFKMEFQEF